MLDRRYSAMKKERSSFIDHYQDLTRNIDPRRGRYLLDDVNDGQRLNKHIVNNTPLRAKTTAVSGMINGTMSPSAPWFKLRTSDQDLLNFGPAADWIYAVEQLLYRTFRRSNLYNMTPSFFGEALQFGTGAMSHVDDMDRTARFHTHTVGSYVIGQNDKGQVDTFAIEKKMTVYQVVEKFGLKNVSTTTKQMYDMGNVDNWVTVRQVILLNPDFNLERPENKFKRYKSYWYEPSGQPQDKFLRESGFDEFPVYVLRWALTGEDIYGTDCPGMTALGDAKSLQIMEREKAKGVKKMVSPLLKGPPSLQDQQINNASSGLIIYDPDQSREGLSAVYQVDPRVQELRIDIDAMENRIEKAFFNDLFFAISNMRGVQPRNQLELTQRNQEALTILGPVLDRIQREFQEKLIERTFNQLLRAGEIPDPPPELEGRQLQIDFVSTLAQAQRSVEAGVLENFVNFAGAVLQSNPQAVDKVDTDQLINNYGMFTGVTPSVIRSDEQVEQIRQARAQAAQQEQQLQAQQAQANANAQNASAERQLAEADNVR